jgi:hypothetical protein
MKPNDLNQSALNNQLNKNSSRKNSAGLVGGSVPVGRLPMGRLPVGSLPMEWMDPMSWRLPSGKALAEFALQAGFLAPLILSGPRAQTTQKAAGAADASEGANRPAGYGKARVSTR